MPDLFHNPYHFVPLADKTPPDQVPILEFSQSGQGRAHPHLTHDRFVPNTRSGRIVCRVTVETPLLCGNEQVDRENEQWTKLIKPFEIDKGKPALPASALRGMLSSLAEAATQSALRVLKDTALSHRAKIPEQALSAMGSIVQVVDPTGALQFKLRPLTAPTTPRNGQLRTEYQKMFRPEFKQPLLKGFINGYQKRRNANGQLIEPSQIEVEPGTFLAEPIRAGDPAKLKSYSPDNEEYWYLRLSGSCSLAEGRISVAHPRFDSRTNNWLLGQETIGDPISQEKFDRLSKAEQKLYTRGILRILGIEDRAKEMPTGKKHEIFVPLPEHTEETIPLFDASAAVERFHALADARNEQDETLPFSVAGSARNANAGVDKRRLRLRSGDLVFFKPHRTDSSVVDEVAVSSIWRAGNGSVHEYFAAIAPDLLPLSHRRTGLTLAEQLFGVVEDRVNAPDRKTPNRKPAFALASRVRIVNGTLRRAPKGGPYIEAAELLSPQQRQQMAAMNLPDYPLKNLASPKPPAPALYFTPKAQPRGGYINKRDLKSNGGHHRPHGRKFYLRRQSPEDVRAEQVFVHPQNLDDRNRIARQHQSAPQFVRPGTEFYFHIDFDNLTDLELQLLCFVLSPVDEASDKKFRHQLGHGKPFGLGQVQIEVEGLLLINRQLRYLQDNPSEDPRFHEAWVKNCDQWLDVLRRDKWRDAGELSEKLDVMRGNFEKWAKNAGLADVLSALKLLGNPNAAMGRNAAGLAPIHYPQLAGIIAGSPQFENKLFEWFVANDQQAGQFLRPLTAAATRNFSSLPPLDREPSDAPPALQAAPPPPPSPAAEDALIARIKAVRDEHFRGQVSQLAEALVAHRSEDVKRQGARLIQARYGKDWKRTVDKPWRKLLDQFLS